MFAGFGHLGGYSSALLHLHVVAGDREGPVLAPSTPTTCSTPTSPHRYRDLDPRPRRHPDAADLVADFLGRPYTFDAYAAWLAR